MSTLSLWAGGCPSPYTSDTQEIDVVTPTDGRLPTYDPDSTSRAAQAHLHNWWPHSNDFQAAANQLTGRSQSISTISQLMARIIHQRGLERVNIVGHGASSGEFQFGNNQVLSISQIDQLSSVSSHFIPSGYIVFYACNMGLSAPFLQQLSNRLQITIKAFNRGVRYSIEFNQSRDRITYRGFYKINGQPQPIIPEPSVTIQPIITSTFLFRRQINQTILLA